MSCSNYGTFTLYGMPFQATSSHTTTVERVSYNTTYAGMFPCRIQFALIRVRSLLLTESQLISFPAGTKTLQFPAWRFFSECIRRYKKSHSSIFGSKATCTSPKLIAACHALHPHTSQVIHLVGSWSRIVYTLYCYKLPDT